MHPSTADANTPPGLASVLVVDDDSTVLGVVSRMLQRAGYSVVACADGDAALRICRRVDVAVDVLLADIVLHDLSGDELATQAVALRPTLRVVFTSGYLDRTLGSPHRRDRKAQDELFGPGTHFLKKPFGQTELLDVVARAMQPERQAA